MAARQTAGRGRLGRPWDSSPGNLHSTCLVTLPVRPEIAAQTSFVAALAVFDMAAHFLKDASALALKWPNDVLLGGAKLSGILIETVGRDAPASTTLAIGIGINLAHAPEGGRYGATSLAEHGAAVQPNEALQILASALDRRLAVWNNGSNFTVVRDDWTARAAGLGGPVQVSEAGRTLKGEFRGLAADGALIIAEPGGRLHAVHAGDVSLAFGTGARPPTGSS
jgi:BirA family biotin operon repressor/biotin-[acetyl-CoA-carboxylase] ligase